MKFLALLLCIASTYATIHLYRTNNIAVLFVSIFTLFTFWLAYEVCKFTKT